MPNFLSLAASPVLLPLFALPVLYWVTKNIHKSKPKRAITNLVFYLHDNFSGPDTSAITVAGSNGPTTSVLQFGTIVAMDNPVTESPDRNSREIGRAQGLYINSQLDGKGLHLVFSVLFTEGEYKGSSLEIQGADPLTVKEKEFSVVSGTGYFRFVRGYGIMTAEFIDTPNLRAILKLDITVKHDYE